jgi:hypothetical protein
MQQHFSCFSILYQEIKLVKSNEHVIIKSKFVDIYEVFGGSGDMENVVENKVAGRGGNNGSTDMRYLHTCPICRMDLIGAGVRLLHGELVKFTGDVVGGVRISVPIIVAAVGGRRGHRGMLLRDVVFIKAVPARGHRVPYLEADLALRTRSGGGARPVVVGATA